MTINPTPPLFYDPPHFYRGETPWSPRISLTEQLNGADANTLNLNQLKGAAPDTPFLLDLPYSLPLELRIEELRAFLEERWFEVGARCLGLLLFKGPLKGFCGAAVSDYSGIREGCQRALETLRPLVELAPHSLPLILCLEGTELLTPFDRARLLSRHLFDPFLLALTEGTENLRRPHWCPQKELISTHSADSEGNAGICLGEALEKQEHPPQWAIDAFQRAIKASPDYRLLCEREMFCEWEGLDLLYLYPKWLSDEGRRMVAGFVAAGGAIVKLEENN